MNDSIKSFTLCSPGGCGSARMVYCLEKNGLIRVYPSQYDKYTSKICIDNHRRVPPKNSSNKILYMYADPRDILLSSLNRGASNDWAWSHCVHLEGNLNYFDRFTSKVTIKEILKDGIDPFGLEEHFLNWLNSEIHYELMLLKYESLEDSNVFQKVLDFFEVDGNYTYDWRPRKTSYLNLPKEQQIEITKLFNNLLKIQSSVDSVLIRKP